MANINLLWGDAKNYMFKKFDKKPALAITIAFALGMVSSSIAQAIAITCNKKISDDKKKFLIPQELIDGAVNVIAFTLIIGSMGKCARNLVETGKLYTPKIKNILDKLPESATFTLGAPETNLDKIVTQHGDSALKKEFYPVYDKFRIGMEIFATTIGSIIAGNIVAPIVRNNLGAYQQKQQLLKEQFVKNNANVNKPNSQTYPNYTRMYSASNRSLLKI